MLLGYGIVVGFGMFIVLLLAFSFLLLAMLAGGLAHAFVSNPAGFVKRLSIGTGLALVISLLPLLIAIFANPELITDSNSRNIVLMFLTPAIPVGCVIGAFVSVFKSRR